MKMLVTGGAGYIGSVVTDQLLRAGHQVVVLDDLSTGFRECVPEQAEFIEGDVADAGVVSRILAQHQISAVLHFAAKLSVPESQEIPLDYYVTNVLGGLNLLRSCHEFGVTRFVFSSTAAVYGEANLQAVTEDNELRPLNPYGQSKMMMEKILSDVSVAGRLRYVALRYFNVAGATHDLRFGSRQKRVTNLIREVARCALGQHDQVRIFGTDYPTADGTCVRDFIHVEDLASAHLLAVNHLLKGGASQVLNCGYGHGVSVAEVVAMFKRIAGREFRAEAAPRRAADICYSVADNSRIRKVLGWSPRHDDLEDICRSALEWEKSLA